MTNTALHLCKAQVLLRVARMRRVDHPRQFRVPVQRFRQRFGPVGLSVHPQFQRFHTLEHNPGGKRRHRPAGVLHVRFDRLANEFPRAQDHAAQGTPLPVDMLGRRINHHVRPLPDRIGKNRRDKHIVSHHQRADGMGQFSQGADVDDLQRWVR